MTGAEAGIDSGGLAIGIVMTEFEVEVEVEVAGWGVGREENRRAGQRCCCH